MTPLVLRTWCDISLNIDLIWLELNASLIDMAKTLKYMYITGILLYSAWDFDFEETWLKWRNFSFHEKLKPTFTDLNPVVQCLVGLNIADSSFLVNSKLYCKVVRLVWRWHWNITKNSITTFIFACLVVTSILSLKIIFFQFCLQLYSLSLPITCGSLLFSWWNISSVAEIMYLYAWLYNAVLSLGFISWILCCLIQICTNGPWWSGIDSFLHVQVLDFISSNWLTVIECM